MSDLAQRINRLEAMEEIRQLKARYYNACDSKNVEIIRDCFVEQGAIIDFGPIGKFDDREQLVAIFEQMAMATGVIDMHHGANIEFLNVEGDTAKTRSALHFFSYNRDEGTFWQLAGIYEDSFRKTADGWRIASTKFIRQSHIDGTASEALNLNDPQAA